ncbi:MAG: bL17 family ribosomal protein [Christensenellales bacterium]|jgi:ribosomal protein L17
MALQRKLGRPTDQREALLRNQVSELLWNGKIETTYARAKEVSKLAEKILTLAINTYTDTVKKIETRKNNKGQDIKVELVNDGAKKLAARRKIMAKVYDLQEQRKDNETKANFIARTENIRHPLIEKIFNEYAPKYAQRGKEKGQMGGYTRVLKLGARRGDSAEAAVIELI